LADGLLYQWIRRLSVALTKQQLIGKLKHEINNPLAAIRNALYLASIQTNDPELERFLKLADAEVSRIATILVNANQIGENTRVCTLIPLKDIASAA
jgi:nitrogen-specific signal transduction histidine kinase